MSSGQLQRNRANFPDMKDRARKRRLEQDWFATYGRPWVNIEYLGSRLEPVHQAFREIGKTLTRELNETARELQRRTNNE